jgi:hypothetical protein
MDRMAWTIIASVVGSLLAVLTGSGLARLQQKRQWEQQQAVRWDEARHELYGTFLGTCNAYFSTLCDVARPMRHKEDTSKVRSKFLISEKVKLDLTTSKGPVDLLAKNPTRLAADRLFNYLQQMNTELDTAHDKYANDENRKRPREVEDYLVYANAYSDAQAPFIAAVNSELKIADSG